jgi:mannose-6-phosphate isomerase
LWHERGWDHRQGGFVERLSEEGQPDWIAPRRVRVQARQIYVYAHAAVLDWYPAARTVALQGFDWLMAHCRRDRTGPGFVHLVAPDGAVLDGRIDAYDQAFGLLALAWMLRLTGDSQIRTLIDAEIAYLEDTLADPLAGGWLEGAPAALPRRQNPQMHAFEAMLALFEATGDPAFLRRAKAFLDLLTDRLIDARSGALPEYFDASFRPVDDAGGQAVEPGHHFEWVWLMLSYARLTGTGMQQQALPLYDWAMAHGCDLGGFAIDEVTLEGAPRLQSRRLWPQTEMAKANLALQEHCLHPEAASRADAALARLARDYLVAPVRGGWIDRIDAHGDRVSGPIPASSFYHIFCAVAEAARVG